MPRDLPWLVWGQPGVTWDPTEASLLRGLLRLATRLRNGDSPQKTAARKIDRMIPFDYVHNVHIYI